MQIICLAVWMLLLIQAWEVFKMQVWCDSKHSGTFQPFTLQPTPPSPDSKHLSILGLLSAAHPQSLFLPAHRANKSLAPSMQLVTESEPAPTRLTFGPSVGWGKQTPPFPLWSPRFPKARRANTACSSPTFIRKPLLAAPTLPTLWQRPPLPSPPQHASAWEGKKKIWASPLSACAAARETKCLLRVSHPAESLQPRIQHQRRPLSSPWLSQFQLHSSSRPAGRVCLPLPCARAAEPGDWLALPPTPLTHPPIQELVQPGGCAACRQAGFREQPPLPQPPRCSGGWTDLVGKADLARPPSHGALPCRCRGRR